MIKTLSIVSLLLVPFSSAKPRLLYRRFLNESNPKAICNDGSGAVYYWRQGVGLATGSHKWVIRLQGGGWCYDEVSCAHRLKKDPKLTSSTQTKPTLNDTDTHGVSPHQGILSSDPAKNPYFYDANQVYLWYCSSDSHIGNREQTWNLKSVRYFYGKEIVKQLVDDLHKREARHLRRARVILITGDSAGGVGTLNNLDYIVEQFQQHGVVPKTVKYRGFVDAGWFQDLAPFNPQLTSFRQIAQNISKNFNPQWNSGCVEAYKSSNELWKCFHAQYMVNFIKTPHIYHQFAYDAANLGHNGIPKVNLSNPVQLAYINAFRANLDYWMDDEQKLTANVFRPACFHHEIEDGAAKGLLGITVNGKSFNDFLVSWLDSSSDKVQNELDMCDYVNCNSKC